jgi:hypothetical protein
MPTVRLVDFLANCTIYRVQQYRIRCRRYEVGCNEVSDRVERRLPGESQILDQIASRVWVRGRIRFRSMGSGLGHVDGMNRVHIRFL